MNPARSIWCEIVFLRPEEGGRSYPIAPGFLQNCRYRPHIVVGDTSQRQAIIGEGNIGLEEYLGVAFQDADRFEWGEPMLAQLALIFPGVHYDALVVGATFTIREGPRIVGYGEVIG